ncbi:MAG: protein kinase [Candidatus Saganbacteria bacterium]|nr:protein kinase [Candidatus Saganbacteria bacterium]
MPPQVRPVAFLRQHLKELYHVAVGTQLRSDVKKAWQKAPPLRRLADFPGVFPGMTATPRWRLYTHFAEAVNKAAGKGGPGKTDVPKKHTWQTKPYRFGKDHEQVSATLNKFLSRKLSTKVAAGIFFGSIATVGILTALSPYASLALVFGLGFVNSLNLGAVAFTAIAVVSNAIPFGVPIGMFIPLVITVARRGRAKRAVRQLAQINTNIVGVAQALQSNKCDAQARNRILATVSNRPALKVVIAAIAYAQRYRAHRVGGTTIKPAEVNLDRTRDHLKAIGSKQLSRPCADIITVLKTIKVEQEEEVALSKKIHAFLDESSIALGDLTVADTTNTATPNSSTLNWAVTEGLYLLATLPTDHPQRNQVETRSGAVEGEVRARIVAALDEQIPLAVEEIPPQRQSLLNLLALIDLYAPGHELKALEQRILTRRIALYRVAVGDVKPLEYTGWIEEGQTLLTLIPEADKARKKDRLAIDSRLNVLASLQEGRRDTVRGDWTGEDYVLRERIERGGMGVVYRARGPQGKEVAAKVLSDARVENRFLQEIRVTAGDADRGSAIRDCPHIIRILDVGQTHDGDLVYIMPYYDKSNAPTLKVLLDEGPGNWGIRLDPATILEIGLQVGKALSAAWKGWVNHRDIKPGNIFIGIERVTEPKEGMKLSVIVADFGIAKDATQSTDETQLGGIPGTVPYLGPDILSHYARLAEGARQALTSEQKREIFTRLDIYALGVVLYEMFTGEKPFPINETADLFNYDAIRHAHPLEQRSIPNGAFQFIERCLSVDPTHRPSDFGEVNGLLAQLIELDGAAPLNSVSVRPARSGTTPGTEHLSDPANGLGGADRTRQGLRAGHPHGEAADDPFELPSGGPESIVLEPSDPSGSFPSISDSFPGVPSSSSLRAAGRAPAAEPSRPSDSGDRISGFRAQHFSLPGATPVPEPSPPPRREPANAADWRKVLTNILTPPIGENVPGAENLSILRGLPSEFPGFEPQRVGQAIHILDQLAAISNYLSNPGGSLTSASLQALGQFSQQHPSCRSARDALFVHWMLNFERNPDRIPIADLQQAEETLRANFQSVRARYPAEGHPINAIATKVYSQFIILLRRANG